MSCPAHDLAASRKMLALEDVDLIREVVAGLPNHSVVADVGAGSGTTAIAVFAERRDVSVLSYDADSDMLNWAEQAVVNVEARGSWRGRAIDSLEAAEEFPDLHADFIILDCAVVEDQVRNNIQAWLPKLKAGGFLLVHDYDAKDAPNFYPDVKKAVDPFLESGDLERVKQQGWSLLTQKPWMSEDTKPEKLPKRGRKKKASPE